MKGNNLISVFQLFLLLLSLQNCTQKSSVSQQQTHHTQTEEDTLYAKKMKCGLWRLSSNKIGLQEFVAGGSGGEAANKTHYITQIALIIGDKDTTLPISEVIDTTTFHTLAGSFSKDKNHVYHYYAMAYGGFWQVLSYADVKSFHTLNDYFAKDKNYVFGYRNGAIEFADVSTFKVINAFVAKDKNHYYAWEDTISYAEAVRYLEERD